MLKAEGVSGEQRQSRGRDERQRENTKAGVAPSPKQLPPILATCSGREKVLAAFRKKVEIEESFNR